MQRKADLDLLTYMRTRRHIAAKEEELLFEYVALELESGDLRKGLWTMALASSNFDERIAKAKYVNLRVDDLRGEVAAIRPELAKAQALVDNLQRLLDEGCSQAAIDHLGAPIRAVAYTQKYGLSREKITKAISVKKLKAIWVGDNLWVEDRRV